MRIMIFGDSASGKSTFAIQLGKKLQLPVVHLDEVMAEVGRMNKKDILDVILREIEKPQWIIEGNAFTKDQLARIQAADTIIVFDFNRFVSVYNHIQRSLKITFDKESRTGGIEGRLRLSYYLPYILWQFPHRKRAAVQRVYDNGKQPVILHSRKAAENYLARISTKEKTPQY